MVSVVVVLITVASLVCLIQKNLKESRIEGQAVDILKQVLAKQSVVHVKLLKGPKRVLYESSAPQPAAVVSAPVVVEQPEIIETPLLENPQEAVAIKKISSSPDKTFEEGFFYVNDQRIGREKIVNGNVVEQSGTIPEGLIKFYDEEKKIHGEERYHDGKREGRAVAYYNDGKLKSESLYNNGKLQTIKEYYASGTLRFEGDYRDALSLENEKEVGVGRLYYPTGALKYHWNLTTTSSRGFKKSYARDGTLIFEEYFDSQGKPVKQK